MISREEVLKLAELSRLQLSETEVERLQKDISSILDYVGQVSAVSGANVSKQELPSPHLRNVLREDVPYAEGALMAAKREALLKAFPVREGDYNVVRKIIQKDE